jgi:cytochrome P450
VTPPTPLTPPTPPTHLTPPTPPTPAPPARRNARYTPLAVDGPLPAEMLRDVGAIRRNPLRYLERTVARHGDLVAFPLPRTPVLLVNTPDGARRVLQDHHRGYGKRTIQYAALGLVTGEGLLTADGEAWRRRRRIAQPAFHHGRLDAVAGAAATAGGRLRRRWDAAPAGTLDVDRATLRTMLEVVGSTLFAADLSADGERVVEAVDAALQVVVRRARSPLPAVLPDRLPTPSRRRLRRAVATLDGACAAVVAGRRARGLDAADADVLALLLRSAEAGSDGGDGLTEREVRDELVTLVIAGHETVASCLTWTLHRLADDPHVQAGVAAELAALPAGGPADLAGVAALPYTRAVVDEALRLYPPAWVVTRRALADDVVSGVEIPAGTLVVVSPWLLHRRAADWPDPERFDPTRFLGRRAPGGGYLPFGAGPRLCIGRDVALVQAVLVLAALLRDRRVVRPPGAPEVRVDALVTLRPRGGLLLQLQRG